MVENVLATGARLLDCIRENRDRQAVDFHVHLHRCNTICSTRHLEVHVTRKVFSIGDVAQHVVLVAVNHQTHCDTRYRSLQWHTGIHQG